MFGKYSLHNLHAEPVTIPLFPNAFFKFSFSDKIAKCPNAKFLLVRIYPHSDQKKLRIWTLFTQCLAITVKICSLKFQNLVLQFFFFSWQSLENLWKNMRVISPFRHKVHNWRIQIILYFINLNKLEYACFYEDHAYHYCFVTVYQSHLMVI